jgi:uncharacterized membrane protein YccF (DUF307 family)
MRFILNLLWAIFGGGLVLALEYAVVGLVCCLTIVGIPFGLQCFKLAGLALFPFGKDYDDGAQRGTGNVLLNIVWFIFAGVWIALTHLTAAIPLAVSIIGIPFALQHVKFALLAISPFGVRVRET